MNAGRRWILIVVGLLVAHVGLMAVMAVVATRDRSFAVVPDSYQKGLHWDEQQALRRASEKLGWQMKVTPSGSIDPTGRRDVTFELADAQGQAVEGATLEVRCFHHAHGHEIETAKLGETGPGKFAARLRMRYAGLWEFQFTAHRKDQTFVATMTQVVNNETRGPG